MNKSRKAKIDRVIKKLEQIQAEIREIEKEEDDSYYNLSLRTQLSDKGMDIQYRVSQISCAADFIDVVCATLEDAEA